VLAALKAMGMKLAIDDFGTGYSSLSYLKRFPIDTLKIDQSFVRDVATDGDDATIVGAVIEMGRNLKQRVIAEGIETPAQLDFLRAQHCDEGQGFHFSHPLSAEAFGHLLRARARSEARAAARCDLAGGGLVCDSAPTRRPSLCCMQDFARVTRVLRRAAGPSRALAFLP
jgi:sensor c-di-GMP phosphodiesterase-like protein